MLLICKTILLDGKKWNHYNRTGISAKVGGYQGYPIEKSYVSFQRAVSATGSDLRKKIEVVMVVVV